MSLTLSTTVTADLDGRVAVVTGASSGLGARTAELLASRGADVALLARRADELEQVAGRIREAGGTALVLPTDVTEVDAVHAAAHRVRAELGRPSIVFNNAGAMLPSPVEEHDAAKSELQVELNVNAVLRVIDVFVDDLVAAAADGGPSDLINTSSVAAQQVFPTFAVYGASKAFVSHLGRHLRAELGPKDVRVTTVEPGVVATDLWEEKALDSAGASDFFRGADASMELLRPDDIAELVAFAVSLPRHVNIQQLTVLPTRQS